MAELPPCTPELAAEQIGWKIQVTVYCTWFPMIIIIVARLLLRRRPGHSNYGIDDWLMGFAVMPLSLGSAFHLVGVHYGLGQHISCLDMHQRINAVKYQYLAEGMNIASIWIVKMSICFFLLRLIEGTHFKIRKFLWAIIIVNAALNVSTFILWAVAAIPIQAIWNPNVTASLNINAILQKYYFRVSFCFNVVIDFIFAFSPIYFLWNIRIARLRKYTIWGLMLLALFPSMAGVLKVVYISEVVSMTDPTFAPARGDDIAALAEQNGGTFVANLPCINFLIERAVIYITGIKLSSAARSGYRPSADSASHFRIRESTSKISENDISLAVNST